MDTFVNDFWNVVQYLIREFSFSRSKNQMLLYLFILMTILESHQL